MGFDDENKIRYLMNYNKSDGFIAVHYSDDSYEYYEDTEENEQAILNILIKQLENKETMSTNIKSLMDLKKISKTRRELVMTLTMMASIMSFEENAFISIMLLLASLVCGELYGKVKKDFDELSTMNQRLDNQKYYLFYQNAFESMDFQSDALWKNISLINRKKVKRALNNNGKLDINTVVTIPFYVLIQLVTNYTDLVKNSSKKEYVLSQDK